MNDIFPAGQLTVADFRKRRFILVPNDEDGRLSVELVRQTGDRWETIWGMGCDDRYQRDTVFDLLWTQSDRWADWGDVVAMSGAQALDAHLRPIVERALRIHMWPRDRWTHGEPRFHMWYTPEDKTDFAPGVLEALDGVPGPSIFIARVVGRNGEMGPAIHLMRTESHETAMKLQTFFLSDEGICQVDDLGDVFVSMGGDAFAVALRHRVTVIAGRFDAKPVCTPKAWFDPRSKRLEPIPHWHSVWCGDQLAGFN